MPRSCDRRWPSRTDAIATPRKLYLDSTEGRAHDVFESGRLVAAPPDHRSRPDRYVYDPLDVGPAELEREPSPHHLTDERYVLAAHGDALIYHTAAFKERIDVRGPIKARRVDRTRRAGYRHRRGPQ